MTSATRIASAADVDKLPDERDRAAVKAIWSRLQGFEPASGHELDHVRVRGAHPHTSVGVVYRTFCSFGGHDYAIWERFPGEDPAQIAEHVRADVQQRFA
ncbi:MAG: hypothetical protein M3P40_04485 [Actinomycetota bacterium]|nr:hypothetical protein [Actinomycetota bacterium]